VLNHFGGSSGNRSFRRLCTASLRSRLGMLVLISEHLLSRARQRAVLSYVKRAEPPKRLSTHGDRRRYGWPELAVQFEAKSGGLGRFTNRTQSPATRSPALRLVGVGGAIRSQIRRPGSFYNSNPITGDGDRGRYVQTFHTQKIADEKPVWVQGGGRLLKALVRFLRIVVTERRLLRLRCAPEGLDPDCGGRADRELRSGSTAGTVTGI